MTSWDSKNFIAYKNKFGLLGDLSNSDFPARFHAWLGNGIRLENKAATFFGFVQEGDAQIITTSGSFLLTEGMYFCATQNIKVESLGKGILIEQLGYNGIFQIGGPIESKGRLRYIDGCTDSLLISPPVLGDPCLNLLHIPPDTFQSEHTHPSFRIGIIVDGAGVCVTPEGEHALCPGLVFMIPPNALHSFKTTKEALLVVAYHPDSDFGPTHENHPMRNRTILTCNP